jgi:hypothetical protein
MTKKTGDSVESWASAGRQSSTEEARKALFDRDKALAESRLAYNTAIGKISNPKWNLGMIDGMVTSMMEDRYKQVPPPAATPEGAPPPAVSDVSTLGFQEDLAAMRAMVKEMRADIIQKQQDPYGSETEALMEKISNILVGSNPAQPVISTQREAQVYDWVAQGMPKVTLESMGLADPANAVELENNMRAWKRPMRPCR